MFYYKFILFLNAITLFCLSAPIAHAQVFAETIIEKPPFVLDLKGFSEPLRSGSNLYAQAGMLDLKGLLGPLRSFSEPLMSTTTTSIYLSQPHRSKKLFNAIALDWQTVSRSTRLEARFFINNKWSTWQKFTDEEYSDEFNEQYRYSRLIFPAQPTNIFQYRAFSKFGQSDLKMVKFNLINSLDGIKITSRQGVNNQNLNTKPSIINTALDNFQDFFKKGLSINKNNQSINNNLLVANENISSSMSIIPRSVWGADESLRTKKTPINETEDQFNEKSNTQQPNTPSTSVNKNPKIENCEKLQTAYPDEFKSISKENNSTDNTNLSWPMTYSPKIYKIIIHHTASEIDFDNENIIDYAARVRAIYYYHTVVRGWGDIGYNFLVDPLGNVYEGRSGGDRVVGGHAYCYNIGTIGIAVIGNLESNLVPFPMLEGTLNAVNYIAKKYNIDPNEISSFHGRLLSNILGHRDVGQTACPGRNMYAVLAAFRTILAEKNSKTLFTQGAGTSNFDFEVLTDNQKILLKKGERKTILVALKNSGRTVWESAGTNLKIANTENLKNITISSAEMVEPLVGPGEEGTFLINLQANLPGLFTLSFSPQFNSKTLNKTFNLPIFVEETQITEPKITQNKKISATLIAELPENLELLPGETRTLIVGLQNNSQQEWDQKKVKILATGKGRKMLNKNTINPQEKNINSGEVGNFIITLKAPYSYKSAKYPLILSAKYGSRNLGDKKLKTTITVPNLDLRGRINGGTINVAGRPNEEIALWFDFKNTGNAIWYGTGPSRVILNLDKKSKDLALQTTNWENENIPVSLKNIVIKPDQVGRFAFNIKSPTKNGDYEINFIPALASGEKLLNSQFTVKLKVEGKEIINNEKLIMKNLENKNIIQSTTQKEPIEKKTTHIRKKTPTIKKTSSSTSTQKKSETEKKINDQQSAVNIQKSTIENQQSIIKNNSPSPLIRIHLASFKESEAQITVNTKFELLKNNQLSRVISTEEKITISLNDIANGDIFRFESKNNAILEIANFQHIPAWARGSQSIVNDNLYRGTLEIRAVDGQLAVINELPLEDYLRGVAEPLPNDPEEKIKTLAVLARTYAYFYILPENRKFPNKPYDGSDDPSAFQKYIGYNYEKRGSAMVQAVEKTTGQILKYGNRFIKTPYFTSSDGYTRTAKEAGWDAFQFAFTKKTADPWSCGGTSKNIGLICIGNRRGHGVGLSAAGAKGLADEGKTFKEIIDYFFEGLSLVKIY